MPQPPQAVSVGDGRSRAEGFVSGAQSQEELYSQPGIGRQGAPRFDVNVQAAAGVGGNPPSSQECFALQIGVNYSDSDQPIGGVVGNFTSMMRFWASLGVNFSQHVLCSDEVDNARRVGASVCMGATLEELYSAMQQVSDAMSHSSARQKFLYLHVVSLTTDAPKPNNAGGRGQQEQFGHAIVPCDHEDCGFLFVDEIAAWLGFLPRHSCFAVFDALQSDPVGSALLPIASGTFVSGCHEDVQFATRVSSEVGCHNVTTALLGALDGAGDLTESQLKIALSKAVRSGVPEVACTSATVLQGWSLPAAGVAPAAQARLSIPQQANPQFLSNSRSFEPAPSLGRNTPMAPSSSTLYSSGGKTSPLFIRRDASVRSSSNVAPPAHTRPEQSVTRAASDARAAFLGTPVTSQGRGAAAARSVVSHNRKAYLSDDSSPEVSRPFVRRSADPPIGRFPTAAQLHSISRADSDESNGLSKPRNAGVTSPIRRRDVSGLGQTVKGSSRYSPNAASSNSQQSLYESFEQRGELFFFRWRLRHFVTHSCSQVVRKMLLQLWVAGGLLFLLFLGATLVFDANSFFFVDSISSLFFVVKMFVIRNVLVVFTICLNIHHRTLQFSFERIENQCNFFFELYAIMLFVKVFPEYRVKVNLNVHINMVSYVSSQLHPHEKKTENF
jgi:hypothetical protein